MANFPELMDEIVVEEIMRAQENVDKVIPTDSVLRSILISTFGKLTPQQRAAIISKLGAEWYLTMAAKIQREMLRKKGG